MMPQLPNIDRQCCLPFNLLNKPLKVALDQFKSGTHDYTTVVTQQVTLLNNQQTVLGIQQQRMIDSVLLIQNLGGGWKDDRIPTHSALTSNVPFIPTVIQQNKN